MALAKQYKPDSVEPRLQAYWQEKGVYHFSLSTPSGVVDDRPVYSIDTPPATVSGHLHLGHVYSYSHTDFMARFWRMNGYNVFYPMGYDDNGLPTERLVERTLGITAAKVGRSAFIAKCLAVSEEAEKEYAALWQRLGLSIDWRYSYRTIDDFSRRTSQYSFIELYRRGRAYRRKAPAIWCPECGTAIAQADVDDLERTSEFVTIAFKCEDGQTLPIATTRPELLAACVCIFVHPSDERFTALVGKMAKVPLYDYEVPILADPKAEPGKGTGAVMCCTFGDTTDVEWWHTHNLPLKEALDRAGRLSTITGEFAGLRVPEARERIVRRLSENNLVLGRQPVIQNVRVHERCDTPVEFIVVQQWYIRLLDSKEALLAAGEEIVWYPSHMKGRYRAWVENLNWDWSISRQRYFGVPFPLWYCDVCGEVMLADAEELPVDPTERQPGRPCVCGGTSFTPESDIFDTWATSSLTPQIVSRWLGDGELYKRVFPMSLRPQAHEIIRTWAFYSILKAHFHHDILPWKEILISGWGLAPEGTKKISKSKGGGPLAPTEMLTRYSADSLRYWTASTGPGKDTVISEEKIQTGSKLINKLWNVARFAERFLTDYDPPLNPPALSPTDRAILSRLQRLVRRTTSLLQGYDYAAAKSEIENFFWRELADNYLEMIKRRLYAPANVEYEGARYTLYHLLLTTIKLFAPFLPYVTEEIYLGLFATGQSPEVTISLHLTRWPEIIDEWEDERAEEVGEALVEIAGAVRRYKSEHNLSLSEEISVLYVAAFDSSLFALLQQSITDIMSITRAVEVKVIQERVEENTALTILLKEKGLMVGIDRIFQNGT